MANSRKMPEVKNAPKTWKLVLGRRTQYGRKYTIVCTICEDNNITGVSAESDEDLKKRLGKAIARLNQDWAVINKAHYMALNRGAKITGAARRKDNWATIHRGQTDG